MPVFRRILLRVNTDFVGCPAKIDAWRSDECRSVRRLRNELRASHSACLVRSGFVGSAPGSAALNDCSRTRYGPVLFFCAGPFGSLHVPLPSGSLPFRRPCTIVQGPDMVLSCLFCAGSLGSLYVPLPNGSLPFRRSCMIVQGPDMALFCLLRRFFWFVTRSASERLSPVPAPRCRLFNVSYPQRFGWVSNPLYERPEKNCGTIRMDSGCRCMDLRIVVRDRLPAA